MPNPNELFFNAFYSKKMRSVYTDKIPNEMMLTTVDKDGWFEWKLIPGTLSIQDYKTIEEKYKVKFPSSFIEWHKLYFFPDCDCSIIRLPKSLPTRPLEDISNNLDWYIAEQIIPLGLVPFADETNDIGPFVFDTRNIETSNDFPIRIYDGEYQGDINGLSGIIFSSFTKMLECVTHFLSETNTRPRSDVISDFFKIDPNGAGLEGKEYWMNRIEMEKTD
jgi:hypothetical protein